MKKISCLALFNSFKNNKIDFFTGIPDSLLKDFCAYIADNTAKGEHIIAANEGGAVALAAGYYLSTGKIPLVYLQNSGLGNMINPLLSLADKEVYGIPMIVLIGWRGEPGVKDEPQHIKQGRIQNDLLKAMEIPYQILDNQVRDVEVFVRKTVKMAIKRSSPVAIIVRSGSFEPYKLLKNKTSEYALKRERAIGCILDNLNAREIVVSTTGKISREVAEYRAANKQRHQNDFLTVGSMGHASQIALGIALFSDRKVVCLDGDGALLMHMGALAICGLSGAGNYIHIVLNNGAHDSVGGQPTVAFGLDLVAIAKACGYRQALSVSREPEITPALKKIMATRGPVFLEIKISRGARENLGRPAKTPQENKRLFMAKLLKNE